MIKFVICGIEHSGTTLVSDLFRQIPNVDSGFEGGVLLCETPRLFLQKQPFAENILNGWQITQQDLEHCCDTDSFQEFYRRLQSSSEVLKATTTDIFDKTPRYLAELSSCAEKVRTPFVVTYKDPRAIVSSDFSRSKQDDFEKWFASYVEPKTKYMTQLYAQYLNAAGAGSKVLTMSLEKLCMEPRLACETMFAHCGYEFRLNYFSLKNLRYHHTKAESISARIPFEYLDKLSTAQQRTIRQHFSQFDKWFYD